MLAGRDRPRAYYALMLVLTGAIVGVFCAQDLLLFYVFCGYVAAYGFAYGNTDSTTTLVGASGAIAGVLGAYLVLFPRARVTSIVPLAIVWIPVRLPAQGVSLNPDRNLRLLIG